jgi:hypothetical protein
MGPGPGDGPEPRGIPRSVGPALGCPIGARFAVFELPPPPHALAPALVIWL